MSGLYLRMRLGGNCTLEARSDKDHPLDIRNDGQKSSIQIRVVECGGRENSAYLAEVK